MLKLLHQLQKLQGEQKAFEQEKRNSEEYRRMVAIKLDFDTDKQRWEQLVAERAELISSHKAYVATLEEIKEKTVQEQAAIYDGSTATVKALSAREAQLAALAEKQNELETKIAAALEKLQQVEKEAVTLKEKIEGEHQEFSQLKLAYQKIKQEYEQKEAEVADSIKRLMPTISSQDLAWFNDNKERFAGTPVAYLSQDHVCDGCRTIVTPVLYKRTVMGQQTYCEKCGRALFTDEE